MNKATHIIVHHTAVDSSMDQFDAVNNYHKGKGFPLSSSGYYIGYHFFIERDGTQIQVKEDNEVGAHTLGGWNKKSIGICLAGNFDVSTPSGAQIASLRGLIKEYKLPYLLHSEAQKNRTCPGKYLSRAVIDVKKIPVADVKKREELLEQINILKQIIAVLIRVINKFK